MAIEPETPGEWQRAVDLAAAWLAFDASRVYGLLEGGPIVNVDACRDMIERGKEHGVTVSDDAVENFIRSWNKL